MRVNGLAELAEIFFIHQFINEYVGSLFYILLLEVNDKFANFTYISLNACMWIWCHVRVQVTIYPREVYGTEVDALIARIALLCLRRKSRYTWQWWLCSTYVLARHAGEPTANPRPATVLSRSLYRDQPDLSSPSASVCACLYTHTYKWNYLKYNKIYSRVVHSCWTHAHFWYNDKRRIRKEINNKWLFF